MFQRLKFESIFSFCFTFTFVRKYWGNKKWLSGRYSVSWFEAVYQCNSLPKELFNDFFFPNIIVDLRYTLSNAAYCI